MIAEIWYYESETYMIETLRWKMRMPVCFAGVGIKNVISWKWNVQVDEKNASLKNENMYEYFLQRLRVYDYNHYVFFK